MALIEQKIAVLEDAKRRLTHEGVEFICNALWDAINSNPELQDAGYELKDFVQEQIHPFGTLSTWLSVNRPEYPLSASELRRGYRIQWVEWMIQCLRENLQSIAKEKK